tara:strand:- start:317 stop:451 length:135 start_codon:yes stop_codon:yes gene_type:complete
MYTTKTIVINIFTAAIKEQFQKGKITKKQAKDFFKTFQQNLENL